jgi:signal transduction histidine kinase
MAELEEANKILQSQKYQLIESEKFAAMGKTAASIAHEIKNPLVSIGGFARLVHRKTKDRDNRDSLQIVINETARLENLLQNILSFARPPEPKPEESNLNKLVAEVVRLVGQEIKETKRKIEIKTDLHVGDLIMEFDGDLIKQVVLNLGRNAIQAMVKGGELTLKTDVNGDYAQVIVSDTGVGIPEHVQESLFTPFFTTKSTGTGLGLAVAKQVVVKHGGFIDFHSEQDRGSVFTVNLPYR